MLTSEGGTGAAASPWYADVFDAARDAAADVATELSSFTKFQKRVDDLIRDLKGSPAGPGEVGRARLVRRQLGGGDGAWAEASGLFTSYETVIDELEKLSRLLSDSMEGMNIAVLASHKGYQNIDLDVRDRMRQISVETTEHYGGSYDPEAARRHGHAGAAPKAEPAPAEGDAGGTI
ncbi:hypothetical protein ACFYP4_24230 [Streptomyces sp. NPDC005551]|uniref:hypothetical protein n=1 Tax=Streptomyces sp. NPDC005551 TaxID=3364725 RepID=UPI003698263C